MLPSNEAIIKGHARAHTPAHSTLISEVLYIVASFIL